MIDRTEIAESKYSEESEAVAENKMGVDPVHSLLVKMSLPMMASMLVMALYNVVDSIFVARLGEQALAAVSYCFPIQQLMVAFGLGTAIGMSALISRFLGAQELDRVTTVAETGLCLAIVNYALFLVVSRFSEQFMAIQTEDAVTAKYGEQYLSIVCGLSIFVFVQVTYERFLQSTGKTGYIFFVQAIGSIINIILDPILIFGLLGAPRLEVAGAAIATVIGQAGGALIGILLNKFKNPDIKVSLFHPKLNRRDVKDIYIIGIPTIVMQSIGSVMVFGLNKILGTFGEAIAITAVATFGVYFKLQSFVFMPVFGMSNAVVPIVAYNYGARKKERMNEAMSISVKYSVTIMTCGMLIFLAFPGLLLAMFNASDQMMVMGRIALRTISIAFPFAGYAIMRGAVFQALGKSTYSMYISIVRQLVVLLPAAYLLSRTGNVNMVWLSFPIAEIAGLTMSIIYSRSIKRDIIDKL